MIEIRKVSQENVTCGSHWTEWGLHVFI